MEKSIRKILLRLGRPDAILGITFVTDRKIAGLNRRYLKRKGPTDVLSFPMETEKLLGDIVISIDTAKKEARAEKKTLRLQCLVLAIHGLLHLLGYDHQKHKDWLCMKKKEGELLSLVK